MRTRKILLILLLLLLNNFALGNGDDKKGHLFIIGGGDWPEGMVLKYIELAGDTDSKITIFPMASSEPLETALEEKEEFIKFGCKNVEVINCSNNSADTDSNFAKLENTKAIFFSGGDQARLTAALLGTKLFEKIKSIYFNGGVVGGTSAGAAVMSEIMITGNEIINKDSVTIFKTIQKGNVETIEGFGFLKTVVIDQHFILRKRSNRLISVMLEHPEMIGIGIDESTAIIVKPDSTFEVFGDRTVMVVDPTEAKSIKTNDEGLFSVSGIKIDIMQSGETYDLKNKRVIE
ncbi:MAG: cyanophycinase [bacterium]